MPGRQVVVQAGARRCAGSGHMACPRRAAESAATAARPAPPLPKLTPRPRRRRTTGASSTGATSSSTRRTASRTKTAGCHRCAQASIQPRRAGLLPACCREVSLRGRVRCRVAVSAGRCCRETRGPETTTSGCLRHGLAEPHAEARISRCCAVPACQLHGTRFTHPLRHLLPWLALPPLQVVRMLKTNYRMLITGTPLQVGVGGTAGRGRGSRGGVTDVDGARLLPGHVRHVGSSVALLSGGARAAEHVPAQSPRAALAHTPPPTHPPTHPPFFLLQNNLHELWALLNFLLPEVFSSGVCGWVEQQGLGRSSTRVCCPPPGQRLARGAGAAAQAQPPWACHPYRTSHPPTHPLVCPCSREV